MSEINHIFELPEDIFLLTTEQYKCKYPNLMAKCKNVHTQLVLFVD